MRESKLLALGLGRGESLHVGETNKNVNEFQIKESRQEYFCSYKVVFSHNTNFLDGMIIVAIIVCNVALYTPYTQNGIDMALEAISNFEEGQFDDAEDDSLQSQSLENQCRDTTAVPHIRAEGAYIDDENVLDWSESESEEDKNSIYESEVEESRVEDEDWDVTERGTSQ